MQTAKCESCGLSAPLGSLYYVGLKLQCENCAKAAASVGEVAVARAVDKTVCSTCDYDNGRSELPLVAELPFCPRCREQLYHRDFPKWLKLGLAALAALLVFALVHGVPYFKAGRSLARGEHLITQQKYESAIPYLTAVVAAAPNCEKCVLLLAKAYLLTGQVNEADAAAMAHNQGRFEKTQLLDEVNAIMNRANRAGALAKEATGMAEDNQTAAAVKKLQQAKAIYPEYRGWDFRIRMYEAGLAFDAKDYDRFVALSEALWKEAPNANTSAMLASALACKYAVNGDAGYRGRAEEMLEKARTLATTDEMKQSYAEYAERIHYRIESRNIISKAEYDRRFRGGKEGK